MPKRYLLPVVEFHLLVFLIALAVITKPSIFVLSATTHAVISEVQISGDSADSGNDEFVELYNPTSDPIIMTDWKLTRKNSSGTEANLVADLDGTIPAHGYFLIGHGTGYNGGVTLDASYSAPSNALTNDYTVLLYSDNQITLVDKVGFGTSTDPEGSAVSENPAANGSIERKPGVSDPTGGNGTDTENNANDFDQRVTSDPQNSNSATETPAPDASPSPSPDVSPSPTPDISPSPTPEVTPTPTTSSTPEPSTSPSPTPDVSPTPSATPDPTPSPTPEATPSPTPETSPSPTPEVSPSPTPEPTPSASPEVSPTPIVSPSPTPETSPSPTPEVSPSASPEVSPSPSATPDTTVGPTPIPSVFPSPTPSPETKVFFRGFLFTCSVRYLNVNTGWFSFSLPRFSCVANG